MKPESALDWKIYYDWFFWVADPLKMPHIWCSSRVINYYMTLIASFSVISATWKSRLLNDFIRAWSIVVHVFDSRMERSPFMFATCSSLFLESIVSVTFPAQPALWEVLFFFNQCSRRSLVSAFMVTESGSSSPGIITPTDGFAFPLANRSALSGFISPIINFGSLATV